MSHGHLSSSANRIYCKYHERVQIIEHHCIATAERNTRRTLSFSFYIRVVKYATAYRGITQSCAFNRFLFLRVRRFCKIRFTACVSRSNRCSRSIFWGDTRRASGICLFRSKKLSRVASLNPGDGSRGLFALAVREDFSARGFPATTRRI